MKILIPIIIGLLIWSVVIFYIIRRIKDSSTGNGWRIWERFFPVKSTPRTKENLLNEIDFFIRAGYVLKTDLEEQSISQALEVGVSSDEIREYIASQMKKNLEIQTSWPAITMNDRIDLAFDELMEQGVVALQNAGLSMSDGWYEVNSLADTQVKPLKGAVFFHEQDVERGVEGQGILLAFGAYNEEDHEMESLDLANEICDVLNRHQIPNRWDGDIDSRIEILPFVWQKRMKDN
jgi:hypothetical protein